ncbi:DNA-binding protein [Polymorphospora sp. NPDC051019]|uniref:DNA-binding protein n=1 Tax=Polymorphospora sp. NPDC051019 TaxID=3155725 RepID=UPI003417D12F
MNARRRRTSSDTGQVWTADKIHALGVSTDLATAAHIFNLSLATAYRLVKTNTFPVPVIRAGTHYRVPTAPILTTLGLTPTTPQHPPTKGPQPEPSP